jgi:hypothetical protein
MNALRIFLLMCSSMCILLQSTICYISAFSVICSHEVSARFNMLNRIAVLVQPALQQQHKLDVALQNSNGNPGDCDDTKDTGEITGNEKNFKAHGNTNTNLHESNHSHKKIVKMFSKISSDVKDLKVNMKSVKNIINNLKAKQKGLIYFVMGT